MTERLTWLELKEFIETKVADLSQPVEFYDVATGDNLEGDFIELKNEDDSFSPVIGLNVDLIGE